MAYLDLNGFKARTLMPAAEVDSIESFAAGWILQQLTDGSAYLDTRLAKRYEAPFTSPYPIAILKWLTQLVTVRVYFKRGVNPSDEQFALVQKDAETAEAEIKEAADSDAGLFDLPLRSDTNASGIVKGGPFSYSEQSPWTWTDVQLEAVGNE